MLLYCNRLYIYDRLSLLDRSSLRDFGLGPFTAAATRGDGPWESPCPSPPGLGTLSWRSDRIKTVNAYRIGNFVSNNLCNTTEALGENPIQHLLQAPELKIMDDAIV